jgi:hypothetical protein
MSAPDIPEVLFVLFFAGMFITLGWIVPIVLGVFLYQYKGYSPHWMWFGIHPVGGWISVLVAACLRKRRRCPACGGYVASNFWLCPFCGYELVPRGRFSPERRPELELPAQFPLRSPQGEADQGLFTETKPPPHPDL